MKEPEFKIFIFSIVANVACSVCGPILRLNQPSNWHKKCQKSSPLSEPLGRHWSADPGRWGNWGGETHRFCEKATCTKDRVTNLEGVKAPRVGLGIQVSIF